MITISYPQLRSALPLKLWLTSQSIISRDNFRNRTQTLSARPAQIKNSKTGIFKVGSDLLEELNETLLQGFLEHHNDSDVKRTHLFNERYENVYLSEDHLPELKSFRQEACRHASNILGKNNIRAGFWFNYMPPGAVTTMHTHDDDDELLSAVYYVYTPENSGNLILYEDTEGNGQEKIEIQPEAGNFIFFNPDLRHEVSKNNSDEHRLSIGINFGLDTREE